MNSAARSSSRGAGFTLIEVLISLAIFAMAAVILGATYVNVLAGYQSVGKFNTRDQDMRFVRTAAVLGEPDRELVEAGGELSLPDNRTARWEAQIEETTVADLFSVALRCEIREPAAAQPWVGEEKFFILRPTWSDPAERDRLRKESKEKLEKERQALL